MISLLIPSRNRIVPLLYCISKNIKALSQEDSEIIVRVDDDDPQIDLYRQASELLNFVLLISPIGRGYGDLHIMYNQLAIAANGDWLWMLNDDAYISEFDPRLEYSSKKILLLSPYEDLSINYFPIMSRKMYDTLGHFSMSPHTDTYLIELADTVDCHRYTDGVEIVNFRDDLHDETFNEKQEVINQTSAFHWEPEVREALEKDIEVLKAVKGALGS